VRQADLLVAVDGSRESAIAVGWATTEAAARNVGLQIVHCIDPHGYGLWVTTARIRDGLRELAQPIVDRAVAESHAVTAVPVEGRVVIGSPASVLSRLSSRFDLLVLGRRGRGALASHLVGSLAQRLLAHATCPVVAVGLRPEGMPSGAVERVVIAVGDSETTGRATELGFDEAALHHAPVSAIHAWHPAALPPAGMSVEAAHPAFLSSRAQHLVERAVAPYRIRHPELEVAAHAVEGSPEAVLPSVCRPGDLLVLGHHEHRALTAHPLGLITAVALHEAPCPVVVIGEPAARQPQTEWTHAVSPVARLAT